MLGLPTTFKLIHPKGVSTAALNSDYVKQTILLLYLLFFAVTPCLAQTPLDFVLANRDKVEGSDRLSIDSALLERLIKSGRLAPARDFVRALEPGVKSQLAVYGGVVLDEEGRHQEAFDWVEALLPKGPFEDLMSVKNIFLKGATTVQAAEARIALLKEREALETMDLALAVATYHGEGESLAVLSQQLATNNPQLEPLPLVKVYLKVASAGLPEASFWAGQVEAGLDELGFDKWSEMYFALPTRQAIVLELLEERLVAKVEQEENLAEMLSLYFQAEQASRPLEARLAPKLDALAMDQPLDRLGSLSQVPELTLYLALRGEDEFARQLISQLSEAMDQGISAAEQGGETPDRLATARQGKEELMIQMQAGVAAGLWCSGQTERGLSLAVEACGDEPTAFTRMAQQALGKVSGYYDLARQVPDEKVEVWTPAALSQMLEQVEVTYWMDRIKSSKFKERAAAALLRYPQLPDNVRKELSPLASQGKQASSNEGEAELKALESISPATDGWTLTLLSVLALDKMELTAEQRKRLEAYCQRH